LKAVIDILKRTIKEHEEKNNSLKNSLTSSEIETKNSLIEAQAQTKILDLKIKELESRNVLLLKSKENTEAQLSEKFKEELSREKVINLNLEREIKIQAHQIESLKQSTNISNQQNSDQQLIVSKQIEIDELKSQVMEYQNKITNLEKSFEKEKEFLTLEIDVLKKVSDNPDSTDNFMEEINRLKEQIKTQQQINSDLTEQLQTSQTKYQQVLEKLKDKENLNNDSEQNTEKIHKENQQLKLEISKFSIEIQSLQAKKNLFQILTIILCVVISITILPLFK